MNTSSPFKAVLLGAVLAISPIAQTAFAETLRVIRTNTESKLNVPMNRAVVVESEVPFAELSIANPSIADISSLSDRSIYVLGKTPGTTTLTPPYSSNSFREGCVRQKAL
jgi:pilus assembly protein CpaC